MRHKPFLFFSLSLSLSFSFFSYYYHTIATTTFLIFHVLKVVFNYLSSRILNFPFLSFGIIIHDER